MKNYYEVLEVSEKASPEVIEKAYKVLAKKHHPDLQEMQNKKVAEEKMKELNEAYEILCNEQKRAELDSSLQQEREIVQRKQNIQSEQSQNNTIRYYNATGTQQNKVQEQQEEEARKRQKQEAEEIYKRTQAYQKKMQQEIQNEYQKQYYNYLRNLGYKIKEKWTWKKILNFLEAIGIFILIIAILWCIPPIRNAMIGFYEENAILQGLVNIIVNIVKAIGGAIGKLFTNPPEL